MRDLKSLEHHLAEAAALFRSADSSASLSLLELLGTALGCDWGTYWKVEPEARVLRPNATWQRAGINANTLNQDTLGRALSLSEGTAGHVWRTRKPVWTENLTRDMCIPRSIDAQHAGLRGGVWFAVKTEDCVYGVFEFLGTSLPPASEELILGLEVFGMRLGTLFEERHSPRG